MIVYLTGPEQSYVCLYSHTIIKSTHLEAQNYPGLAMTHCMIPQSLAQIQIRLREATRDIQDHAADEWTSSDMNRAPLILNTIYSQAGPIAL